MTIENASAFLKHVKVEDLLARCGEVHARPSSTGVSLISLHPESPQLGSGGLSPRRAAESLASFSVGRKPGRSTPEKALQAAVLADAYRRERRVAPLECLVGPTWFVADELALPDDAGRKVVCDLICAGLRDGRMVPVVVELKSDRTLARLVDQVTAYAELLDEQRVLFGELASVVLGRQVSFAGPPEKWIVWPALPSGIERHDADLARAGIRRLSYTRTGAGYSFAG